MKFLCALSVEFSRVTLCPGFTYLNKDEKLFSATMLAEISFILL